MSNAYNFLLNIQFNPLQQILPPLNVQTPLQSIYIYIYIYIDITLNKIFLHYPEIRIIIKKGIYFREKYDLNIFDRFIVRENIIVTNHPPSLTASLFFF